jgi:hypothetical protein
VTETNSNNSFLLGLLRRMKPRLIPHLSLFQSSASLQKKHWDHSHICISSAISWISQVLVSRIKHAMTWEYRKLKLQWRQTSQNVHVELMQVRFDGDNTMIDSECAYTYNLIRWLRIRTLTRTHEMF